MPVTLTLTNGETVEYGDTVLGIDMVPGNAVVGTTACRGRDSWMVRCKHLDRKNFGQQNANLNKSPLLLCYFLFSSFHADLYTIFR